MIHSTPACRLIGCVALVMMLLCQTMAAALACVAAPVPAQAATQAENAAAEATVAPACHHDVSVAGGAPASSRPDRCASHDAACETAKLNIPAAALLALPVADLGLPACEDDVTARYEPIAERAAPPPLRLVYCRLLN